MYSYKRCLAHWSHSSCSFNSVVNEILQRELAKGREDTLSKKDVGIDKAIVREVSDAVKLPVNDVTLYVFVSQQNSTFTH